MICDLERKYDTHIRSGDTPIKQWAAPGNLSTADEVKVLVGKAGDTIWLNRAVDSHSEVRETDSGQEYTVIEVQFTTEETAEENIGEWDLCITAKWNSPAQYVTYPEQGFCKLYIEQDM